MRVHWEILESGNRRAEAQFWQPEDGSSRLILFCPGFPGTGSGVFEQRHAAALAESGYALAVLRHAGTRLDTPSAPLMINNAARLMQARRAGETLLGGAASSVADWLLEPLTALLTLSPRYEEIIVLGNSFGALSSLWSLTEPNAPLDKVRHLILLAGAQGVLEDGGVEDVMRIWKPEFVAHPLVTEKVSLEDPERLIATIESTYRALPERAAALPAAIRLTSLVVAQDELLRLSDSEKFRQALGGRGTIMVDEINQAHPAYNLMAHDMPDYPTENLLALIDPDYRDDGKEERSL